MLLELKRERPELVNIKAGLQRVRELLEHPRIWAAVEALAAALLEKKTLTGKQAYSIIAQVIGV
jgi:hypothetical protein